MPLTEDVKHQLGLLASGEPLPHLLVDVDRLTKAILDQAEHEFKAHPHRRDMSHEMAQYLGVRSVAVAVSMILSEQNRAINLLSRRVRALEAQAKPSTGSAEEPSQAARPRKARST